MGDQNQLLYAKTIFKGFKGKILEIGSKDYGKSNLKEDFFFSNEMKQTSRIKTIHSCEGWKHLEMISAPSA